MKHTDTKIRNSTKLCATQKHKFVETLRLLDALFVGAIFFPCNLFAESDSTKPSSFSYIEKLIFKISKKFYMKPCQKRQLVIEWIYLSTLHKLESEALAKFGDKNEGTSFYQIFFIKRWKRSNNNSNKISADFMKLSKRCFVYVCDTFHSSPSNHFAQHLN